jgi:hypothetical protein
VFRQRPTTTPFGRCSVTDQTVNCICLPILLYLFLKNVLITFKHLFLHSHN